MASLGRRVVNNLVLESVIRGAQRGVVDGQESQLGRDDLWGLGRRHGISRTDVGKGDILGAQRTCRQQRHAWHRRRRGGEGVGGE